MNPNGSIIDGLTNENLSAILEVLNTENLYYPTIMPTEQQNSLIFSAVLGKFSNRAKAKMVSRGSTIPRAGRPGLGKVFGDIPKIAIGRDMDEDKLNEYLNAKNDHNTSVQRLIEMWAEDPTFVWNAVQNEIEFNALQSISRGKCDITVAENYGSDVLSEFPVDYELEDWQKGGYETGSAAWTSPASAKPITVDFKTIIQRAKSKGKTVRFAIMNADTFANFAQTDEVIRMCASYLQLAVQATMTPSLEQVNNTLRNIPYLKGLQISVIDQSIENGSGVETNPFVDNSVLYSPSKVLGKTFWTTPIDMKVETGAQKAMRGVVCVKKFGCNEPVKESTLGIANAMPVWTLAPESFLMDSAHSSWNIS